MLRVILEKKLNAPPEYEVNEKLSELGEGWKVVSARTDATVIATWKGYGVIGNLVVDAGDPKHIIYSTTIVLEKIE